MTKNTNPLYRYQRLDVLYRSKTKKAVEELNKEQEKESYFTQREKDRFVTLAGFVLALSIMYGINKCTKSYQDELIKKADSIEYKIKKDTLEYKLK